jgi:uncharacterized protein YbaR (Trm112 family)/SAM-dependent methyltransferase
LPCTPTYLYSTIACPIDKSPLDQAAGRLVCRSCGQEYPIVDGVPILLDPQTTLFASAMRPSPAAGPPSRSILRRIRRHLPYLSWNIAAKENYKSFSKLLSRLDRPAILIVGAGEGGVGTEALINDPRFNIVRLDVFRGSSEVVGDGHDLPFQDAVFDAVICQAVLEHVLDPVRCVAELHRVLKPDGLVYAETPFIQQVHAGAHDFTRFTLLGHRRLFRYFAQLDAGVACGPAMALAWSIQHFLQVFSTAAMWRNLVSLALGIALYPLRYVDYAVARLPQSADAASAFYFLGRRQENPIPDADIIASHWNGGALSFVPQDHDYRVGGAPFPRLDG